MSWRLQTGSSKWRVYFFESPSKYVSSIFWILFKYLEPHSTLFIFALIFSLQTLESPSIKNSTAWLQTRHKIPSQIWRLLSIWSRIFANTATILTIRKTACSMLVISLWSKQRITCHHWQILVVKTIHLRMVCLHQPINLPVSSFCFIHSLTTQLR